MQINVVHHGTPQMFNMMVFPEKDYGTQQWLRDRMESGRQMLNQAGQIFMQKTDELYQQMFNPEVERVARSMLRTAKGFFHPNHIVPLNTIQELQSAKPVMQRYIMAQPDLRRMYHRQLCNGYSDSYTDHHPGDIGEEHYDYRRVMHGIGQEYTTPEGEYRWKVQHFYEDLHEGDRPLHMDEQDVILDTWDLIKTALSNRRDPTDIFNGELP